MEDVARFLWPSHRKYVLYANSFFLGCNFQISSITIPINRKTQKSTLKISLKSSLFYFQASSFKAATASRRGLRVYRGVHGVGPGVNSRGVRDYGGLYRRTGITPGSTPAACNPAASTSLNHKRECFSCS